MRIVAVIAFRNEAPYLANLLRHLKREGIEFFLIDNQSEDDSTAICKRAEFASHLVGMAQLPFDGSFDLSRQLETKTAIMDDLEAEWIIHMDADEILHPNSAGETLSEAIARLDEDGFTVINFEEFVFLPVAESYRPDEDGAQPMRSYYFHAPGPNRLMRAWRKSAGLSMKEAGGHVLTGGKVRLAPENFVLRHYIVRDQAHAYDKYSTRLFSPGDRARGWHGNRVGIARERFRFPEPHQLQWLDDSAARCLSTAQPRKSHYWFWSATADR